MGLWGIPDDVRRAARARIGPPPTPALLDAMTLSPELDAELKDDIDQTEAQFGTSARARRATIVACLVRVARDWHPQDEGWAEARFILVRAADPAPPPYCPAVDALVAEVRALLQDAREPLAPIEALALDSLHAFLFERLLSSGQQEALQAVFPLADTAVRRAVRRGARFEKDPGDVAVDSACRLQGFAKAYRPDGMFNVGPFLRSRLALRLDDERRMAGSVAYSPRRMRELKRAGRVPVGQFVSEQVLIALREQSVARQRHVVPADCVNCKELWAIVVTSFDEAKALHDIGEGPPPDKRFDLGQRTVDMLVQEFERHRGIRYPRVGRSKSIPRADVPAIIEFLKARRQVRS